LTIVPIEPFLHLPLFEKKTIKQTKIK